MKSKKTKISVAIVSVFGILFNSLIAIIFLGVGFFYVLMLCDNPEDSYSEPTYVDFLFDSLPKEKKIKSKCGGFGQGFEELDVLYYDDISDYFTSEKNQYFFRVNGKTAAQLKVFIKNFEEGALFKFKFDYNCIDTSDWVAFINPEWKSEDQVGDDYIHTSRSYVFFDSQSNTMYYFFQEL